MKVSWGVWVKNLQQKPVTDNVSRQLLNTALGLFVTCVSVYVALLIYEWRFISWFWWFLGITLVVLLSSLGNLWWEIYWGRRWQKRHAERLARQQMSDKSTSQ